MTSPWSKIDKPEENLAEIMSEEFAHRVHNQELKKYEKEFSDYQKPTNAHLTYAAATTPQPQKEEASVDKVVKEKDEVWEDYSQLLQEEEEKRKLPPELLDFVAEESSTKGCDSDEVIAQVLQSQFDHEYNKELRRIEEKRNAQSKVTVSLDKYHLNGDMEFLDEPDDAYKDDEDEAQSSKRDWDRFETNRKKLETIPKCGFKIDKEGEMITKHDLELCGVRNACRVMSFPPEFQTGDGAGFDMKLSNKVYNQLKTYSCRGDKKAKGHDRKENVATAEIGIDAPTRLLLYKLINNQILEQINGIISTGKEAVLLHANSDPAFSGANASGHGGGGGVVLPPHLLPKECAVKIFKTTLNEFKQRDRYIKDDFRFKDRFSKQNNRVIINMWAEKEMHNLMRMQRAGINCPDVVVLKKNVLVMSFIGDNHISAPKLKDVLFSDAELCCVYEEIIAAMHKLYNEAKLVHADLSEYNILWYNDKCWFIDLAQAVEPEHPSALEFLMRDCGNIINFFRKRRLPNIYTKEQLFEYVTALNAETHNAAMLERIHTRGASIKEATAPNQEHCPDELKPLAYPFDLAWEKSQANKKEQKAKATVIDKAADAMQTLDIKCSIEAAATEQASSETTTTTIANIVNTAEH